MWDRFKKSIFPALLLMVTVSALTAFATVQIGITFIPGEMQFFNNSPNSDYGTLIAESPVIVLDGPDGGIYLGAGDTTAVDWFLSRQASNLAVLGAGDSLGWEGATANAYESIQSSADVAQDVTWTMRDVTSGAAQFGDILITQAFGGTAADHLDTVVFVADRAYVLEGVDATWGTAESTGAMSIMVEKLVGVTACASGTDMLSAVIDGTGTANTTTAGTLHGTAGNLAIADGDTICIDLSATPNEIVNLVVSLALAVD
jgi:hypothetical protein